MSINNGKTSIKQNRKLRLLLAVCLVALIIATTCIVYVLNYDKRAQEYSEDFKTKATAVALDKARSECLNEVISDEQCSGLVAIPLSEASKCDSRFCWTVYVHSQNEEVYSANVTVAEAGDGVVVVDYLRNEFDSSN